MRAKKATKTATKSAQADGRPAVEAWLRHVTSEQQSLVRRLDRLILEAVPDAVCAVKFRKPSNPLGTPFYGLPGQEWLAHMNSLKARVRLTLYAGNALKPVPPIAAPNHARAIDIGSDEDLDEKQLKAWLQQAKKLPGWGSVPPET